jgi:hypothetical protein
MSDSRPHGRGCTQQAGNCSGIIRRPVGIGALAGSAARGESGTGGVGPYLDPLPTLDDLLADEVMAPVLRSAGYEPDEFREMMTEMAWNLVTPYRARVIVAALHHPHRDFCRYPEVCPKNCR